MSRRSTTFVFLLVGPVVALSAASSASAATPTYYANQAMFQADITNTVTDTYSNPGYVFAQNNVTMSGVLGQTDYISTGHPNTNLVFNAPADPRYCAGCNGSFQLSFQTTTVGNAAGVNGVGLFIDAHDMGTPYYAFITFADGTTANIALPGVGNFWGVAAPERIQMIHFGLSMGGVTQGGSFAIDDLIVGGGCESDANCIDDGDPCTSPVCFDGMCGFVFNNAPCNDGNLCTEQDTCAAGVCGGSPVDCEDGNVCTTNFCDPAAGCVLALNTEPCDDGDSCTEMDACSAGACAGVALDCNDDDVCSVDSCVDGMGCVNEPTPGCCSGDEDCASGEICDLERNACVPEPAGSSGVGDTGADTGGETGLDGTGAGTGGGESGIGTAGDTASLDTGGSTSAADTGVPADGGAIPEPDFSVCNCTSDRSPQDRLWWLMAGLGLFLRRRRGNAA